MSEDSRKRLIEAEVVNPPELRPAQRDAFLRDLYSVHEKIFAGVSMEEFTYYIVRPDAVRTRIQIYRNETGVLVGYCAVHIFERRSKWRRRAVLRAEAGLLPDYRGSASTLWFGTTEAFRYKLMHPLRSVVFFAMPVHPSSFHLISRYFWRCYPFPHRQTPKRWQKLLLDLAQTSGVEPANGSDPLIRHVGWITRENAADIENWRKSRFEDIHYYLSRNPLYSQGNGLAVIAPLSAGNLAASFMLYVFHKLTSGRRGYSPPRQCGNPAGSSGHCVEKKP